MLNSAASEAGFNGATAMKPWKRSPRDQHPKPSKPLQWGHGDEAVEEVNNHHQTNLPIQLQWGHGDEAVEEGFARLEFAGEAWVLQWGHGDEAVEETASPACGSVAETGFNGATAMKPWKRRADRLRDPAQGLASMGPRR